MITNLKEIDRQKLQKIAKLDIFLKNHIFRFLIMSLVIFDLKRHAIPQIKAKDISFGPYSFSFLAKINILWERKWWSCLVFFPGLYIHIVVEISLGHEVFFNLLCSTYQHATEHRWQKWLATPSWTLFIWLLRTSLEFVLNKQWSHLLSLELKQM